MSVPEEILINTKLLGDKETVAGLTAEAEAMGRLGVVTEEAGLAMERTSRRGFLMNQALFTVRRFIYGTSIAAVALGVASLKMGFSFTSAMQQAAVALGPVFNNTQALNDELNYLFNFTKLTPFQFKDITVAFRQMYGAMRPLGISAQDVNTTIKSLVDALSFAGRTSPGALNRVAVALQHLAFMGRLTGQVVLQLARDGLPIYAALQKELHLTADQIHNIGKLGIPSAVAIKALNDYIESTPGFANAAARQATGSLHGLFTTFKDNMMQLFGTLEKPLFDRIQKFFAGFNAGMSKISETSQATHGNIDAVLHSIADVTGGGKPLYMIMKMIVDIFHDFFVILGGVWQAIKDNRAVIAALFLAVSALHGVLALLAHTTYVWVPILKLLIALWLVAKVRALGLAFAEGLANKAMATSIFLSKVDVSVLKLQVFWTRLLSVLTLGYVKGAGGRFAAMTKFEKLVLRLRFAFLGLRTAVMALSTTVIEFLATNPIGWIILAIAAVGILYWRWKAFRDWVNRNWPYLAAALITPFGAFVLYVIKHFDQIKAKLSAFFNWVWGKIKWLAGKIGWLGSKIPGFGGAKHLLGGVVGIASHIPGLAGGGNVAAAGAAIVGERGAELVSLPMGAQVSPIDKIKPVFRGNENWMAGQGSHGAGPQVIQLVVDGRVLAEVVGNYQRTAEVFS